MTTSRLEQAALNNALWCDAVCRAHGATPTLDAHVWFNSQKSPPFYPNVDTLTQEGVQAQMAVIETLLAAQMPGDWGVKDSFFTLDLASLGFFQAFEASWIWRPAHPGGADFQSSSVPASPTKSTPPIHWKSVQTPAELAQWEAAWSGQPNLNEADRIFLPSLLTDERLVFLAAYRDAGIVAGGVASRTGEVVGLSNVFTPAGEGRPFWAGFVGAVAERFPGLPFAGYEQGDDLAIARALGFEAIGPLRVWIRAQA